MLNGKLKTSGDAFFQRFHILVYLLVGNFRIDLGRFYLAVAEHPAHRLDWNALRECNFRGVGVSCHVERQSLFDAAGLGNPFQLVVDFPVATHWQ